MSQKEQLILDDLLNDLTALFPSLESEIESAFSTITQNGENTEYMHYQHIEPVIRHFLFIIGYGEYLTKVTHANGTLKLSEVEPVFNEFDIRLDIKKPFNLDDWKLFIYMWVRRIQQIQRDELIKWKDELKKLQEEQQKKFALALKAFQYAYINQIEAYNKEISVQIEQEVGYRREWETQQSVQEKFLRNQKDYVTQLNEDASKNYIQREIVTQQTEFVQKLLNEFKNIERKPLDGADRVITYAYPASITSVGAPVSGGGVMPRIRSRQLRSSNN